VVTLSTATASPAHANSTPGMNKSMTTPLSEELREKIASQVEPIILRRLHKGRLDGYTLETSCEIAEAVLSLLPVGWEGDSSSCTERAASVASQPDCSTAQSFDGGVLKPCPFCGGTRIGGPYRDDREGLFYVACISKPGRSCGETFAATEAEAAAAWNTRAMIAAAPDAPEGMKEGVSQGAVVATVCPDGPEGPLSDGGKG
jgi:hypothetical protein